MTKADPTDVFFNQYAWACAWGSLLELRMRILADNTPALEKVAHDRLEEVEKAICEHFVAELTDEERKLINRCRYLRNKVIHGNFSLAKETLEQLGHDLPEGAVTEYHLPEGSLTAESLSSVLGGPSRRVCDTPTKKSTIVGWLMECGQTGVFESAAKTFQQAIEIVERLLSGAPRPVRE